jgi:tetratricopeptide (TPR) repeat protein
LVLRRLVVWSGVVLVSTAAALGAWLWHANKPVRQLREAVAGQRWSEGLHTALTYLAANPNDAEVLRLAARCLSGKGHHSQAESFFARAGELNLEDLRTRAEGLISLGRATEAVEVLTELRQRGGEEPAVLQRLAILEFQRGYHDAAFQLVKKLGEHPDHTAASWCIQATFHVSLRHAPQAIECLEEAFRLNPAGDKLGLDAASVSQFMGAALLDVGQSSRARDWLRRSLAQAPISENYWYLGEAELGCGDLQAAEQAWRRALELDPTSFDALVSLAKLSLQEGRPQEALEWLTIAERQGRNTSSLHTVLSRANARLGHTDIAAEHARKADELREQEMANRDEQNLLAQYPQHIQARLLMTRKAVERGNVAEAKAMVEELLREYPENRDLLELRSTLVTR